MNNLKPWLMNPYLFFRKSRSPGKRASRSPSRSPGRPRGGGSSPFGSDENDRVNNNDFLQQNQKSAVREREEEKRRLQAEMRRREQELLAKIKEQQRELETMKQEKGKVNSKNIHFKIMRGTSQKLCFTKSCTVAEVQQKCSESR